jgi:putative membrane protein
LGEREVVSLLKLSVSHINFKSEKYMNKSQIILGAIALSATLSQLAFAQSSAPLSKEDSVRLTAIAQANIAEVDAGKLALQKSSNGDVKAFAQLMIDDHTKGLEETKKVAAVKNLTLPTEPDAAHKKMAEQLKALETSNFDKEYVDKAGVQDHTKVHAALTADMKDAKDADVKALATKLEPTVAHHLAMSKKLKAALK